MVRACVRSSFLFNVVCMLLAVPRMSRFLRYYKTTRHVRHRWNSKFRTRVMVWVKIWVSLGSGHMLDEIWEPNNMVIWHAFSNASLPHIFVILKSLFLMQKASLLTSAMSTFLGKKTGKICNNNPHGIAIRFTAALDNGTWLSFSQIFVYCKWTHRLIITWHTCSMTHSKIT